ncbi:MAG: MBOAT family protein [Chthoniobacteraceae bacterium]
MVFSSPLFLFLFLPIVLTLYMLLPGIRARNLCLLTVSLIFYAWGEVGFIFLLLGSTLVNWFLGLRVDREQDPGKRKRAVTLAIVLNIGLLVFFKYTGPVLTEMNAVVNTVLSMLHLPDVHIGDIRLPIGISFFTFHALSYVMDIYRRKSAAARNPADTALYIFFFPQLVAGPILRWSAIAPQLVQRVVTRDGFAEGIRRFVGGLAKKMIIANAVALPADKIFGLQNGELTPALAWFGTACYTVQIYFDFSGYSDMAVGLGKMFGFQFLENFDHPYISQSVKEFWRRWHISLSSWFRDYLYIPLGGNRCSEPRNYLNLVIVFFLCGLWHGANWTFVVWGLYHGLFLVLERTRFGTWVDRMPRIFRHGYALMAVMIGWVLFRANTFPQALAFLSNMAGLGSHGEITQPLARYVSHESAFALIAGAIFATPVLAWLKSHLTRAVDRLPQRASSTLTALGMTLEAVIVIGLLLISSAWLAGGTYNPFIYFRF